MTTKDLNKNVLPLLDVENISQFMKVKGVGYVNLKKEILQIYTISIMYYLYLVNQCIDVRNHPVLTTLTDLKKMINVLSQIDDNI